MVGHHRHQRQEHDHRARRLPSSSGDRRTFVGGNLGTPLSELPLSRRPGRRGGPRAVELPARGHRALPPAGRGHPEPDPRPPRSLPGMAEYGAAKARLFENQQPGDVAVVNERDPRALAAARSTRGEVVTFGFGPRAPMAARDDGEVLRWTGPSGDPERYLDPQPGPARAPQPGERHGGGACARLMGVPGAGGPARARRVPRPPPPPGAGGGAGRRGVGERLQGHQRRLDGGRPRRLPGRSPIGGAHRGRARQGGSLLPAPAALPGARARRCSRWARTRRPSSGSSATSAPPSPAATSPRPSRAPPSWPRPGTWCSSRRPARATTVPELRGARGGLPPPRLRRARAHERRTTPATRPSPPASRPSTRGCWAPSCCSPGWGW